MIESIDVQAVVSSVDSKRSTKYLLLKRFDKDKNEDHYRLVKGGLEGDESAENAVLREVKEETGLSRLKLIGEIQDYSYTAGEVIHKVKVFLLVSFEVLTNIDSSNEGGFTIKETMWVDKDMALSLLNFDQEKNSISKADQILSNLPNEVLISEN